MKSPPIKTQSSLWNSIGNVFLVTLFTSTLLFGTRTATMLATASTTGTVIRVFLVPTGEQVYAFRRGSYEVSIYSLSFCPYSKLLAVGSSSGTVHIFSLDSSVTVESMVGGRVSSLVPPNTTNSGRALQASGGGDRKSRHEPPVIPDMSSPSTVMREIMGPSPPPHLLPPA